MPRLFFDDALHENIILNGNVDIEEEFIPLPEVPHPHDFMDIDWLMENILDMRHRYVGSYASVRDGNENVCIRLTDFFKAGGGIGVNAIKVTNNTAKTYKLEDVNLSYPDLGVVKWRTSILYLSRGGRNVWRQGLIWEHLDFYDPFVNEGYTLGESFHKRNHKKGVLNNIFNPKYYTLDYAIDEINSGRHRGVPLSNHFYLGVLNNIPEIVVGYKKWIVGRVDIDNRVILNSAANHLEQEISQFVELK